MEIIHLPVMVKEATKVLNPIPGGTYVDATIGPGGHSEAILTLIGTGGKLIGIDRDNEALRIVQGKLSDKRVILRKGNFSDMENLLNKDGITEVEENGLWIGRAEADHCRVPRLTERAIQHRRRPRGIDEPKRDLVGPARSRTGEITDYLDARREGRGSRDGE